MTMPFREPFQQPHPCDHTGCEVLVPYDDEPMCFLHSPDSGSSVSGYSWAREHRGHRGFVLRVVDANQLDVPTGSLVYVASSDPDFVPLPPKPPYPSGVATWTTNIDEALVFPTAAAALEAWHAQSTTVPLRPDGKPNRPLTATSCEVVSL